MNSDYSPLVLKQNMYQLQMNRTLLSVIAGIFCGIVRVEGILNGLVMYCICQLVGSVIMWRFAISDHQRPGTDYFPSGIWEIFTSLNFSGIMTFILVWTLVYDLVHIF